MTRLAPVIIRFGAAGAGALLLVLAGSARADDAPRARSGDAAGAEALFEQGRKLLSDGKVAQACPKFAESYRLDPALGSLLNLANCHQLEGKTATAWGEFREAEQQARRAKDAKRQKYAASKAGALEPSLPKLIVTVVDPAPNIAVTRDGVALGEASLNTALPVDPGEHVIAAEAPGRERWETRIEAAAGQRSSVVVPALEMAEAPEAPAPPEPAAAPAPAPTAPKRAVPDASTGSGARTAGLVIGGLGLASVAVGAVFAGLFFDARSACNEDLECRGQDDHPRRDAMNSRGTISGVTLGAGAAGLIVGGILFFTAPSAPDADPEPVARAPRLHVTPLVGSHGAAMRASVRF